MAEVYAAQDGDFDSLCLATGQVAAPKAPKAPKDVVHHHPPKEMAADVGFPVRGGQTLLIAYFPWEASEADIEREFCRFCRVKRVHLVVHKSSQKPRCFGFVKFMTKADAEEALHATSQGLVQLLDARGHIWHLKAEWTKSGDMVVDDSETEQEVAKRKEDRRFRTDRNAAGDSPAEDCVHPAARGRGSRWPGSSVKGQMPMMQHPMPPLHQQHQHQLGYQQLSQGYPPAQQHQQQNYSPQGYGSGQPYLSSQQAHHHYGSSSGSYAGNPQEPYPPSLSSYGGGPQGPHSPPWEGYGPPASYSPQGPQPQGHQQQSYSQMGYGNGGQQPYGSGQQGYTCSSSQSYQSQQQGYGGQAYSSPQQQLPPSQQHHHHQQGLMGCGGYAQGPPPPLPMQTHLDMSACLHDCGRQASYSSPPQPSQNETGSMPGVVPNMVNDPALHGSSISAVGGSSVPGQQQQQQQQPQQQHHQTQQQNQQHQHQQHQHSQHNQQQHLHPQHQLHQHQQPQLQPQNQQQQLQHPSLQQQQHQPQDMQATEGSSLQHLPSPPAQQPPAPPAGRASLASGHPGAEGSGTGATPPHHTRPDWARGSRPAAIWNSFDDAAAKGMVDGLVGGEDGGVSQHMPMWTPNVA